MNRKKCYCSNKFCKCLFGCGCTISSNVTGKCMCCIMEENDKRLLRRGRVVPGTTDPGTGEKCKCDDKYKTKFYDIIVFNIVGEEKYYWSCRYGCLVELNDLDIDSNDWEDGVVEEQFKELNEIKYHLSGIETGSNKNILIVKEENLTHVWCSVKSIPDE